MTESVALPVSPKWTARTSHRSCNLRQESALAGAGVLRDREIPRVRPSDVEVERRACSPCRCSADGTDAGQADTVSTIPKSVVAKSKARSGVPLLMVPQTSAPWWRRSRSGTHRLGMTTRPAPGSRPHRGHPERRRSRARTSRSGPADRPDLGADAFVFDLAGRVTAPGTGAMAT